MQFMTPEQEKIFDQLVELAGGNFSLVEEALFKSKPGGTPKLEEVIAYIVRHIEDDEDSPKVANL